MIPVMMNPGKFRCPRGTRRKHGKRRGKHGKRRSHGSRSHSVRLSSSHRRAIRHKVGHYRKARRHQRHLSAKAKMAKLAARYAASRTSGYGYGYQRTAKGDAKIAAQMRKLAKRMVAGKRLSQKMKARRTFGSPWAGHAASYPYQVGLNSGRRGRKHHRKGRHHMSFKHYLAMNPPSAAAGITAGVRPANVIGVAPVIGGAILNGMLRKAIAQRGPAILKGGIGGVALGLATAGIVGAVGGHFSKRVGQSMILGGVVETLSELFVNVRNNGVKALSLSGVGNNQVGSDDVYAGNTLSDFAWPQQVGGALSTEGSGSQYSLPAPGPMVAGATPQEASTAAAIAGMSDEIF